MGELKAGQIICCTIACLSLELLSDFTKAMPSVLGWHVHN